MPYTVSVIGFDYEGGAATITKHFMETFDAPDWVTALAAAYELAKIDDRDIDTDPMTAENYRRLGATDEQAERWAAESACDLGDGLCHEQAISGDCSLPRDHSGRHDWEHF